MLRETAAQMQRKALPVAQRRRALDLDRPWIVLPSAPACPMGQTFHSLPTVMIEKLYVGTSGYSYAEWVETSPQVLDIPRYVPQGHFLRGACGLPPPLRNRADGKSCPAGILAFALISYENPIVGMGSNRFWSENVLCIHRCRFRSDSTAIHPTHNSG